MSALARSAIRREPRRQSTWVRVSYSSRRTSWREAWVRRRLPRVEHFDEEVPLPRVAGAHAQRRRQFGRWDTDDIPAGGDEAKPKPGSIVP